MTQNYTYYVWDLDHSSLWIHLGSYTHFPEDYRLKLNGFSVETFYLLGLGCYLWPDWWCLKSESSPKECTAFHVSLAMWEFITAATKTIFYDNCHWIKWLNSRRSPTKQYFLSPYSLANGIIGMDYFTLSNQLEYFMKSWFKTKAKTKLLIFRSLNQSIWSFVLQYYWVPFT